MFGYLNCIQIDLCTHTYMYIMKYMHYSFKRKQMIYNNNNNSNERDTLKLIPSLNYFINKNTIEQIEEEKKELDLSEKIDSYLNKLEKYNQTNNNKVFRIMEQENNKIGDEPKNVRIMEQEDNRPINFAKLIV